MSLHIPTIYLGGTFSCVGQPLSPLNSVDFFAHINSLQPSLGCQFQKLGNLHPIDSSQITTETLQQLLSLLKHEAKHHQHILIIQGTDTASYSSAFFAYICAQLNINLIFLVSMQPLFKQTTPNTINMDSDAYQNLLLTCNYFKQTQKKDNSTLGQVFITDDGQLHQANNLIKTHRNHAPTFTDLNLKHTFSALTKNKTALTQSTVNQYDVPISLTSISIQSLFCLPQTKTNFLIQLNHFISQKPDAIILIGYGSGNVLYSEDIKQALITAHQNNIIIVLTSQVPFGKINDEYEAGSWLNECAVLSSQHLSISAIFAKLLYVCACTPNFHDRLCFWQQLS